MVWIKLRKKESLSAAALKITLKQGGEREILQPALSHDEIPDDDVFLDEMIALLDKANAAREYVWSGRSDFGPLPPRHHRLALGKRVWRAMSGLLFYSALALAVLAALIFSKSQGEMVNLIGYSYFTVMTTSMQSSIPSGSLIITKRTDAHRLNAGDIITFFSQDAEATVTHRITEVIDDGTLQFRTKGDNNTSPDADTVPAERVIGKVVLHMKNMGKLLLIMQKKIGWVLTLFLILLVLSFTLQQVFQKDKKQQGKEEKHKSPDLKKTTPYKKKAAFIPRKQSLTL